MNKLIDAFLELPIGQGIALIALALALLSALSFLAGLIMSRRSSLSSK